MPADQWASCASARPNVVIFMADDLGFGDLGLYNFGSTETPHIDSIARDGAALGQHYSASPICAPARAAFLTGRYPQRSGVIDTFPHRGLDRLALVEHTLGDLFAELGHRTGLIGKWHNGALGNAYHPLSRGFDEFVGFRGGVQDYWDWRLDRNGSSFPADGRYLTDVLSTEAVDFIDLHHDQPFMLFVAFTAPHGPFQAPDDAIEAVRRRRSPGPVTLDVIAAMVEVMDRGVGRVLEALDRHGLTDDTIVMFTSDNGPWMRSGPIGVSTVRYNLGLAGGKELVHEGGVRVPMLIKWPGRIASGRVVNEIVHFTDWVPTLLEMAAGSDLERLPGDGRDVGPALRGEPTTSPTRCWQWSRYRPHPRCNAAIRDGDWKLIYPARPEVLRIMPVDPDEERRLRANPESYVAPSDLAQPPAYDWDPPAPQLFNLRADPGEQHDLAGLEPERAGQLSDALAHWFASVERDRHLAM